jgi:hypothetical protein
MNVCDLHEGDHLCGLLPAVPGIRDTEAIPVVREITFVYNGQPEPATVRITWLDGTTCEYRADAEVSVLRRRHVRKNRPTNDTAA